jgi:asparagine synthase (glutamine-hydrolysing)
MSGIFGIYHPDDRPIVPAQLQKMASSIAHRGPDGTKTIIQDHIGFGHSMLQTTPESLQEHLPYIDTQNDLAITSDARIDNRDELAKSLDIRNISKIADSQLILRAYQKWGIESFIRLIGDFAFVIWDHREQQLLCVRDYIGVKPFYFHHSASQFLFSSEIKQLVEHPDIARTVNKNMVGEYLTFSFCSNTETLFQDINRLAPGHYLRITPDKITTNPYWSLTPGKQLHYKKTREYTEHFMEIFTRAVTSRLRCNTPISAELSGGLDSSLVVAMACKLSHQLHQPLPETYGMVFPGLNCDERSYIDLMSKTLQLPVHYIDSLPEEKQDHPGQTAFSCEPPDIPNLSMRNALLTKVSQSHSRVLLSGIGGDEWFTGSGYPYLDLFNNKKYSMLFAQLYRSCSGHNRHALKRLTVNLFWPLIPSTLRKFLCRRSGLSFPPWLSDKFILETHVHQRFQKTDPRVTLSNLGNLSLYQVLSNGVEPFFLETADRYHAKYGIEYRSPFLDRRIVEFAASVPDYERRDCEHNKRIFRHHSNTLLPEAIRKRHDKAEFSYFFGKVFSSKAFIETTTHSVMAKKKWIDEDILKEMLIKKCQAFNANRNYQGSYNWEIWFAYAIEVWLKETIEE